MRIHVLLGQFGHLFSLGFAAFAERLKTEFPDAVVQVHDPHSWPQVVEDVRTHEGPFVLLGYSLGGNALTWASEKIDKDVALTVIYDATTNGPTYALPSNFKKVISYVNTLPDFWGHANIIGKNVENIEVQIPHIFTQAAESLHQQTIEAIHKATEKDNG